MSLRSRVRSTVGAAPSPITFHLWPMQPAARVIQPQPCFFFYATLLRPSPSAPAAGVARWAGGSVFRTRVSLGAGQRSLSPAAVAFGIPARTTPPRLLQAGSRPRAGMLPVGWIRHRTNREVFPSRSRVRALSETRSLCCIGGDRFGVPKHAAYRIPPLQHNERFRTWGTLVSPDYGRSWHPSHRSQPASLPADPVTPPHGLLTPP